MALQSVIVPRNTSFTCAFVMLSTLFSLFTITTIPSFAITVGVSPAPVSLSFQSRDAIPMSQVPSAAEFIPVVESLS